MKYNSKTDSNHTEIKNAFESVGCTVFDLSGVGGGMPDLVVGLIGINLLVEVKPIKGKLNDLQNNFFDIWRGHKTVIRTPDQALALVYQVRAGERPASNR